MKKKYFEDVSRKLLMMILLIGGFLTQAAAQNYIVVFQDIEEAQYGEQLGNCFEIGRDISIYETNIKYDNPGSADGGIYGPANVWEVNSQAGGNVTEVLVSTGDATSALLDFSNKCASLPKYFTVENFNFFQSEPIKGKDYKVWGRQLFELNNPDNNYTGIIYFVNIDTEGKFKHFARFNNAKGAGITLPVAEVNNLIFKLHVQDKEVFSYRQDHNLLVKAESNNLRASMKTKMFQPLVDEGILTVTDVNSVIKLSLDETLDWTKKDIGTYSYTVDLTGVQAKLKANNIKLDLFLSEGSEASISEDGYKFTVTNGLQIENIDVVEISLPGLEDLRLFESQRDPAMTIGDLQTLIKSKITMQVNGVAATEFLDVKLEDFIKAINVTFKQHYVNPFITVSDTKLLNELTGINYCYQVSTEKYPYQANVNDMGYYRVVYTIGESIGLVGKSQTPVGADWEWEHTISRKITGAGHSNTIVAANAIEVLKNPTLYCKDNFVYQIDWPQIKSADALKESVAFFLNGEPGMKELLKYVNEFTADDITILDDKGAALSDSDYPLVLGKYSYKVKVTANKRVIPFIAAGYEPSVDDGDLVMEAGDSEEFTALQTIAVVPTTERCYQDADDNDIKVITFEEPKALDNIFDYFLGDIHFRNMVDGFEIDKIVNLHELFPNNFNTNLEPYDFEQLGLWFVPTQRFKVDKYQKAIAKLVEPTVEDLFNVIGAVKYDPNADPKGLMYLAQMGYYDVMVVLPEDEQVVIDASSVTSCNVIDGYNLGNSRYYQQELHRYFDSVITTTVDKLFKKVWVSEFPVVVLPKALESATFPAYIDGSRSDLMHKGNLKQAGETIKEYIYGTYQGEGTHEFIDAVLFYEYDINTPTEYGKYIGSDKDETIELNPEKQYSYSVVLNRSYIPLPDLGIGLELDGNEITMNALRDALKEYDTAEVDNYVDLLRKIYSERELLLAIKADLTFKGEAGSPNLFPHKLGVDILNLLLLINDGLVADKQPIVLEYGMINSIHVRKDASIELQKYEVGAVGYLDNEEVMKEKLIDIIYKNVAASLVGSTLKIEKITIEDATPIDPVGDDKVSAVATYTVFLEGTKKVGNITPIYLDAAGKPLEDLTGAEISDQLTIEEGLFYNQVNWISFIEDKTFVPGEKIDATLTLPTVWEDINFGMTAKEMGEEIKSQIFDKSKANLNFPVLVGYSEKEKLAILSILENLVDVQVVENTIADMPVYVYADNAYPKASKDNLYGYRLYMSEANANTFNRLFNNLKFVGQFENQQVIESDDLTKYLVDAFRSLEVHVAATKFVTPGYGMHEMNPKLSEKELISVIKSLLIKEEGNAEFFELAVAAGIDPEKLDEAFRVSIEEDANNLYHYVVKIETLITQNVAVNLKNDGIMQLATIDMEFIYPEITATYSFDADNLVFDVKANGVALDFNADKNAYNAFEQTVYPAGSISELAKVAWDEYVYRHRLIFVLYGEHEAIPTLATYKDKALAYGSMEDLFTYVQENITEGVYSIGLISDFNDEQASRNWFIPVGPLAKLTVVPTNVVLSLNNDQKEYTRDYKKPVRTDADLFFGPDAKAIGLVANVFSAELTCNVYKLFLEGTDIAYSVDAAEGSYPVQLRADALDFVKPVVGVKYAFDFTDATIIVKKQTSMEFDYKKINATWSVGAGGFPAAPIFDYEHSDIIDTYGYNWFTVTTGTGSELNPALWTKLLQNGTLAWFLYEGDITNAVVYKAALTDIFAYLENNVTDGVYSLGLYDKHGISSEYYYIPVREELAEIIVTGKTVAVEFKETGYSKLYGLDVTGVTPALSMQSTEGAAVPNETIIDWITDVKGGFAADAALGTYTLGLSQEALDYANANAPVGYKYVFGTANKATLTVKQMTWGGQQTITVNGTREYGDDDSKIKVSFDYPVAGMAAVLDPIFEGIDLAKYVNTGSTIDGKTNAGTYTLHMFDQDKVLIALLANYDVKFKEGKLVITPAELTVTIKDVTREFGAANPTEFEIEYTGMKRNESPKKDIFTDNILPIAKTDATAKTRDNAPIYFANWDKISAKNYTLIPVTGTLYIAKIGRTIIWDQEDPLELEVGQTVTLSANVKLSVEGISYYPDVAFKLLNGNCPYLELGFNSNTEEYYITGKAATINSVDAVEVTAFCEGNNDNYAPAAEVTKKIVVIDGDGDITKPRFMVSGLNTVYNGEHKSICADIMDESGDTPKPVTTYDVWYEGYGTTVYPESKVGPKDVGTYQVTVIATLGGKDGKQNTYTYIAPNKLRVNPKPVTIIAQNFRIMYGDNLPDYKYAYTILGAPRDLDLGDDIPELVLGVTTTQTPAGTYKLAIEVDNDLYGSNYCFNLQDGELLIDKAPLTIVANDVTATYGDALKPLSYSLNGMKYGQGVADLLFEPRVSTTATATSNAGIYDIIVTGAEEAANYELEYVDGIYTINQASQFIVWNQDPATFDILDGETAVLAMPESNTGREVTLVSNAPEIATVELVDGEWVMTLISEGDVTITAELAGDDNYLAADPVAKDFIVKNTTGVVAIGDGQIKVYPTLFVSTINVLAPSAVSRVDVISYTGAIVKTVNNPTTNIDLSSLGSGDYLLKVTTVDGIVATAKVVKQ